MENKYQPAHPVTIHKADDDEIKTFFSPGLSKREHIAALAMAALLTEREERSMDYVATTAVYAADKLLEKLDETNAQLEINTINPQILLRK